MFLGKWSLRDKEPSYLLCRKEAREKKLADELYHGGSHSLSTQCAEGITQYTTDIFANSRAR